MGKTDAKPLSLQDAFLNSLRKSKTPATIFLMKGVKLQGIVTWFDPFSLLLRRDGNSQLVYKHAISTIMPFHAPQDLPTEKPEALSGKSRQPLQDIFLHAAEREGEGMTVFLVNGVMLQGNVSGHDQFSVLLSRQDQVQLVYKHAISTMQPNEPLDLSGDEAAGDDD